MGLAAWNFVRMSFYAGYNALLGPELRGKTHFGMKSARRGPNGGVYPQESVAYKSCLVNIL